MSGFDVQEIAPVDMALSNILAERALLGSLMYGNGWIDMAADRMDPADFIEPLHGRLFSIMLREHLLGHSVNSATLAPFFSTDEDFGQAGGVAFLNRLTDKAVSDVDPTVYVEQIHGLAIRRKLVGGVRTALSASSDLLVSNEQIRADIDTASEAAFDAKAAARHDSAGNYAAAVIASFGQPIRGVKSGVIGGLDDIMGPLRPGSLDIMAGRPGMGKTTVAGSFSHGAASRGHGVLFVSLEMSADELTRRILSDMTLGPRTSGVPYEDIRDGFVRPDQMRAIADAKARLDAMPLEIAEPGSFLLADLRRLVRQHKRKLAVQGVSLDLVVVDYLTLLHPSRKGMSLYEHATEVSRGLKAMAKDESLAVLALAQLSREVEKRTDKRPIPSDLRDSGQIEQDADVIVFLYREFEYLRREEPQDQMSSDYADWQQSMTACHDRIEYLVEKRRNGPTGKHVGYFFRRYQAARGGEFFTLPENPRG